MLSAFPHLDETDFERACDGLQRRFQLKGSAQEDWLSVEKIHRNGTVYLNITTHLPRPAGIPAVQDRDATEVDEVVEHDEVGGCPTSADKSSIQVGSSRHHRSTPAGCRLRCCFVTSLSRACAVHQHS
jgi:hypothetical protein